MPAFTVIDHTELGASASSWDVTSIPSSYDHLMLKVSARTDATATYGGQVNLTFNGDTGTNYSGTLLWAYQSPPQSTRASGATSMYYSYVTGASQAANTFGSATYWIPNYSNTANYKQVLWHTVAENASTASNEYRVSMTAGLYKENTDAIDEMKMIGYTGSTDIAEFSTFTLYGVKGA